MECVNLSEVFGHARYLGRRDLAKIASRGFAPIAVGPRVWLSATDKNVAYIPLLLSDERAEVQPLFEQDVESGVL